MSVSIDFSFKHWKIIELNVARKNSCRSVGVCWVKVTVMCLGAAAHGGEAERAPLTLADPTEHKDNTGIPLESS